MTGDNYVANGSVNQTFNGPGVPSEFTMTVVRSIIGAGPDNNAQMHVVRHMTVNANGTVTSAFSEGTIVCQ